MHVHVPISVGELVDKLTILEIKLAEIGDPAKLANVTREYEELRVTAPASLAADPDLSALRERLKATNARLWRIEDDLRAKERALAFDAEFIALARAVYVVNDARAALKREINRLSRSALIEEKSYAAY